MCAMCLRCMHELKPGTHTTYPPLLAIWLGAYDTAKADLQAVRGECSERLGQAAGWQRLKRAPGRQQPHHRKVADDLQSRMRPIKILRALSNRKMLPRRLLGGGLAS